ncbi:Solute carrier family 25 member 40 [Orchesella cincta]|uniref:Solute carrier family 25 member 40 n=1 Tax=Orchesella cincta TaxID=48709 RepID=A0A1D2MG55_ORCCI|nr:Solute carrier family 25 member 40 [Orchesella cincta]
MKQESSEYLVVFTVTPLDVIKIRLQSQQKALLSNKCFVYCNGLMDHICHCVNGHLNAWVKRPGHFTSTIDAFHKIVRNEGVTSLWSGLPPTLIMAVPATIVYFVTYEQLRVGMIDRYQSTMGKSEYPVYIPLFAGGLARLWAVTVVNPLELIRTKMQSRRLTYKELRHACADLYEARGIKGFWMGYVPSISRDVPFSAIYWGCYEAQKKLLGYQQETPITFSFAAGAIAGSVAGTITLPFDVVKTYKQIEMGEADFKIKGKKLATSGEIVKKIYSQTGIHGLFTGFVPRIIKVAPACAIMISTYEYGKSFFMKYNRRKYDKENGISSDD